MTKYDWTNVDNDVEWIATDEDMNSWGFITKSEPFIGGEDDDQWVSGSLSYSCKHIGFRIFKGDWQDSLEERPHDNSN